MSFDGPPPSGSRGPPPPPGGGSASQESPFRKGPPPPPGGGLAPQDSSFGKGPPPPLGGDSAASPDFPFKKGPPPPTQQIRDAPGGNLGAKKGSGRSAGNEDPPIDTNAVDPTFVTVEARLTEPDYRTDHWDPIHFDAFQPNGWQNMQYKIQQSQSVLTARTSNAQYTPLHIAVKFNRLDNVHTLLAAGAPVNNEDILGQTPYILACRHEVDAGIRQELMARGPDLEHVDRYSWTALFWACRNGQWSNARELLRAGVRRDGKDKFGRTAYEVAAHDLIRRLFG